MTTPAGPVYFFDQPRQKKRNRGRRNNLDLNAVNNKETHTENKDQSDGPDGGQIGEARQEARPEISSSVFSQEQDVMEAYMRAAPQLLSELAHVLSQHKWSAEGRVPHGLVNILSYTWQELTAGARLLISSQHIDKSCKSRASSNMDLTPRPLSAKKKPEIESAPCQVKPRVSSNIKVKKRKSRSCKDLSSTSLSFSILNQSSKDPDWIIQHQDLSCTEDIRLYKWAVDRLHGASSPLVAQTDLNRPPLLRHYGDAQAKPKDKCEKTKTHPGTIFNGLPQIPDVKQLDPVRQKLHYRINDGSSFIYYPSGFVAVCQSYSGLPCGGFYTNVFSDSDCSVIIATVTAFGHGTVMHPRSSAISAVWDQRGGLIFNHKGSITKEWSWPTGFTTKRIIIQVSNLISLELFSGTSAVLSFRCDNEHVQLPLPALSHYNSNNKMPHLQTNIRFTSDTAQDICRAQSPTLCTHTYSMTQTHDVQQMVKEVQYLEEASSLWRREGLAIRELRRIQLRVQCTLDAWMDFYCMAIGIKCPHMKRMPDVPPRSRLKREVQSATLPSLNSPERTDAGPVPPQDERVQQRHLSASEQRHQDSIPKFSSPLKKRSKEDCPITQIGPLQLHGSINRESVIFPEDPDEQSTCLSHPVPFSPSVPLTHCPVLLRAALTGDGPVRRCCCSPSLMPALTDLEYDPFIMGQPRHSHQMLIVCVTCQNLYPHNAPGRDPLEQLYRRRNKHRTMPCTQSQMDSFRLVKYDISIPKPCFEAQKALLQQRHNAAPGMVLMYIKGKLLFIGYITSNDHSCPMKDIEKQISKARGDYRSGLHLPSDFKFSKKADSSVAKDTTPDILPRDEHKKMSGLGEGLKNSPVKGPVKTLHQAQKRNYHKQQKTLSVT